MLVSHSLILAILGRRHDEVGRCDYILSQSRDLGVDPLLTLIHRYGIGESEAYARAARHCGIAFSDCVPANSLKENAPTNLNGLADIRSVRGRIFDRDVVFIAPGFSQFLTLQAHLRQDSEMVRRVCIVPPRALRHAVYAQQSPLLMDQARQELARRWPQASAHLELTKTYRVGFLIALILILLGGVIGSFLLNAIVFPVFAAILLVPAWFRLSAMLQFPAQCIMDRRRLHLLDDADLPVYSVLLPLRDEAHMVPQLAGAMRQLDYPALCIKRTK